MKKILFILIVVWLPTACTEREQPPAITANDTKPLTRSFDYAQLQRGEKLFHANCAQCHGREAEGSPNWRQAGADGKYPPPPLNGTAHAWHHPNSVLMDVIKNGTIRIGGNMPPWRDKLSDAEIADIMVWFQAKWSDEVYAAWLGIAQRASQAPLK